MANGSSRGGGGTFPVGTYATWKKTTAFFLDWLLLARGHDKRVPPAKLKLDALQGVKRRGQDRRGAGGVPHARQLRQGA